MLRKIFKEKLLFFLLGFVGILVLRILQVQFFQTPFIPQKAVIQINPPSSSLKGQLVDIKGEIKKKGREDKEFKEINKNGPILQGESISTGDNGNIVVKFENNIKLTLSPNSEITFVDTIPSEFLIQQTSGNVVYEAININQPISIRALHVLVSLEKGQGQINVDQENMQVIIDILDGEAKIGYVDLNEKTQVLKLNKGEKLIFDDQMRTWE